jgi:5'-nucleotidase
MAWILTNDDGIDAPGIKALEQAISGQLIVVAPRDHQSGCGHQVTTTQAIAVERRSPREFAVGGTPADCVRLAISQLCEDVEHVFSGINAGGNLGVDAYISGTIAAVREAAFHGIPGVAISQYRQGSRPIDWDVATRWSAMVLDKLLTQPLPKGRFWNVNLPHLLPSDPEPNLVFCQPSTCPLPIDYFLDAESTAEAYRYAGRYANRDRIQGTDVDVCFGGNIAITQIAV